MNCPVETNRAFFIFKEPMKYPNLRYGNPVEFRHYAQGIPVKILAKRLRRSERSIKEWLAGTRKIPYWVPEIIRLWNIERDEMMRQMNLPGMRTALGVVTEKGVLYELRPAKEKQLNIDQGDDHDRLAANQ